MLVSRHRYILVIAIALCMASNAYEDVTTTEEYDADATTQVPTTTEEYDGTTTQEVPTTTLDMEVESNETDTRQSKGYYLHRRPPMKHRGSMKYKPAGPWNQIPPGFYRPRPWVKPGASKTDFSDYHIIDINKLPAYTGDKVAKHDYKVEESQENDLEGAGSEPLPSLASIIAPVMSVAPHVNDTVLQVEKILKAHPELPRLDREQILHYLNNITEVDKRRISGLGQEAPEAENHGGEIGAAEKEKTPQDESRSREEDNRSLMVVLPFKPNNETDMSELYTRRPVVQVLPDQHKVTTYAPKFNMENFMKNHNMEEKPSEEHSYIPVNKEDNRYNPPLRVIGFRYNHPTTTELPTTHKTYTNYDNIELVTQKFELNEDTISESNHKDADPKFNEPVMDNFGFDDAIVNNEVPDSVSGTDPPVFITNPLPDITERPVYSSRYSTTTERYEQSTTRRVKTTTTTTDMPDFAPVLDLLPDNMKDVLTHIGIGQQPEELGDDFEVPIQQQQPAPASQPTIDPMSFQIFKPLPVQKQKTIADDMRDFLASFGLMPTGREAKAAKYEPPEPRKYLDDVPTINADILTDDMKSILQSLGLLKSSRSSRIHIFNPSNHSSPQSELEVKKLNALLGSIKKLTSLNETEQVSPQLQAEILQQINDLDNLTISNNSSSITEEIKEIMVENKDKFNFTVPFESEPKKTKLDAGPDPVKLEDVDLLKNEVKRQENETKTEDTEESTQETETKDEAEAETESSNAPGLEDSFGGGDTAPADADVESSLPPKRPNGLYLLLDWNSFLQVGTEDDARRVNIQFQPKIGDGRNFLPVTIP